MVGHSSRSSNFIIRPPRNLQCGHPPATEDFFDLAAMAFSSAVVGCLALAGKSRPRQC